jgi:hypothetical protein
MDIASFWSIAERIIPASDSEELRLLLLENIANPLSWGSLIKSNVPQVTNRIRKYVLNGDAKEAWRLKDSYKDTFALEAVSVSSPVQINVPLIIDIYLSHMLKRKSIERPLSSPK